MRRPHGSSGLERTRLKSDAWDTPPYPSAELIRFKYSALEISTAPNLAVWGVTI